jgi:hypothetical protein
MLPRVTLIAAMKCPSVPPARGVGRVDVLDHGLRGAVGHQVGHGPCPGNGGGLAHGAGSIEAVECARRRVKRVGLREEAVDDVEQAFPDDDAGVAHAPCGLERHEIVGRRDVGEVRHRPAGLDVEGMGVAGRGVADAYDLAEYVDAEGPA